MSIHEKFFKTVIPQSEFLQNSLPMEVSFAIDSRSLVKGQMFLALQGERHDGHNFLSQALARGCSGLIIAQDKKQKLSSLDQKQLQHLCIIVVPDPLRALVELAAAWRQLFSIPVVAITGSIGKTSTKNILGAIVKEGGKNFLVSHGNQNTVIGVALNILRLNQMHDGAIFEVGINQRGEMARIVSMLRPTSALITYIGHSHMEGLGSLSDIALEKSDIFKFLRENDVGFINGDLPVLANSAYAHPVIKFGLKMTNQIQARKVAYEGFYTKFILKIYKQRYPIILPTNHAGALLNTLAAASAAHHLGIADKDIVTAIQKPIVVAGRFEKRALKMFKGFVINDCYNASPESMKAALLAFHALGTESKKIAVLGDMLELGTDSAFWHRQLGRFLKKVPSITQVILVGSMVEWTKKTVPAGIEVVAVPSWQEALKTVHNYLAKESVILVKGSNGIGLYNLVNDLSEPSQESV